MSKHPPELPAQQMPETYDIRVQGHLDLVWAARLDVPDLTHEADGTTVMRGVATDQAALHGLLQRIRDLGLPLVSVIRVDPIDPSVPNRSENKK